MTPQELAALAEKIASGIANDQEIAVYYSVLYQQQVNAEWQDDAMGNKQITGAIIRQRIFSKMEKPLVRRMKWTYAAIAASVILIIAAGWFWVAHINHKNNPLIAKGRFELSSAIQPGGNRATLQLADGSAIILDSVSNGVLAQQSGTVITKQTDGRLAYASTGAGAGQQATDNTIFNTLSTPRGGQYTVTLPDGTRVWLNAASSIRYPVAFTGNDRHVSITGEAYFEVAPLVGKPFKVSSESQQIAVLGTSFNVNAYDDENATKTTLITGSISITNHQSAAGKPGTLLPGQQAIVSGSSLKIIDASLSAVVAWKNGLFEFNNADVRSIMRQLSRWYDVKIIYKGTITEKRFTGKILRNAQLSEVLNMLSYAGISFAAKDKIIEVTN